MTTRPARRAVLTLLIAGAALSATRGLHAQPPRPRRVGFLTSHPRLHEQRPDPLSDAFVRGMREHGYVEGESLLIEWRHADEQYDLLPELAAELVGIEVEVIVAYGTDAAHVLRRATTRIPIVVAGAGDPVGWGIVASLERPGGNITGLAAGIADLAPIHVALLKEMLPALERVVVLTSLLSASHPVVVKRVRTAAQALGVEVVDAPARPADGFAGVFASAIRERAGAALVLSDGMFAARGPQLAELALAHRLPMISAYPDHAAAGALMSYGLNLAEHHRRAAAYVDRILQGARPADLPMQELTTFELVVNRRTARQLAVEIAAGLLRRADRVIE
jgi:putative ABC transport system substrate-binding protein